MVARPVDGATLDGAGETAEGGTEGPGSLSGMAACGSEQPAAASISASGEGRCGDSSVVDPPETLPGSFLAGRLLCPAAARWTSSSVRLTPCPRRTCPVARPPRRRRLRPPSASLTQALLVPNRARSVTIAAILSDARTGSSSPLPLRDPPSWGRCPVRLRELAPTPDSGSRAGRITRCTGPACCAGSRRGAGDPVDRW